MRFFTAAAAVAIGAAATPAWADDTTELVSANSDGIQGNARSNTPAISADGNIVAFDSDASNLVSDDSNGVVDIFVRDRLAGTTERVSVSSNEVEGNAGSLEAAISADGRFAAFTSEASNLVSGGTTGIEDPDVFVRDRQLGTTERVSVSSDEVDGNAASLNPAPSADGRFAAFASLANNLVVDDNTAKPTFSSATASWARPSGSACRRMGSRATIKA